MPGTRDVPPHPLRFSQRPLPNYRRLKWTSLIPASSSSSTAAPLVTACLDGRERTIASVVRRRGQPAFRRALIKAYGGKCALTGCDAEEALEAAHIVPYKGSETNHVTNGLLLRSDLHSLFDLGLIAVDTETMTLLLRPDLLQSSYKELERTQIRLPQSPQEQPSKAALDYHRLWAGN